ncbi:biotin transporter BioY [Sporosarcina highlanderae]|uniref:Biotin transporter n=1 Tax=Sporosarcina highlanderae TaxID=3035916 RepID=A0ABT8JN34_9BACL|nr:biotin transporter BioY [Sporosarcina highlanderae]MDN4606564.1 biotin transporter BioY [Sporosarcina highlanderae]
MTTATVKTKSGMSALSLVYCGMFSALMMIGANITWFVPFLVVGGVPITLQTFFAVMAGLLLGSRLGATAMTVYMITGLAGAPIFAKFQGGFGAILLPTFGFIVSFILVAYIAGKIVEKYGSLRSYVVAGLVALVVNYVIGTNWMYFAYKFWAAAPEAFSYSVAWMWMVPPLPKDILLSILAGIFGHRMYKILRVRRAV